MCFTGTMCIGFSVMPALVAGIHVFAASRERKTWMAGTSPAMTKGERRERNKMT